MARLRGELAAAERSYEAAARSGGRVQPGLALLRLAQGAAPAAALALDRALEEARDALARARLLPAKVEVDLALGRLEEARTAAAELARVAALYGSRALEALADHAAGAVALAADDPGGAVSSLRRAAEAWQELLAPYDEARTRALLGAACRALGDEEGAALELDAARAGFVELGARTDLERLEGGSVECPGHRLSRRELQVLTLLARGETNRSIASHLGISDRTVDRHVSNIFDKLGVASRAEAAAFAARHGLG
ncbi:MAG TPA: helix-turn-helix transcriptional regulator [Trueperaceae bacterium]|nr:helix-turn-helix transcriptional regulator [Trueperaceae bacterium]